MQWGEEGPPPLLVKIAPDLSKEDLEDIAAVCIYVTDHFFFLLKMVFSWLLCMDTGGACPSLRRIGMSPSKHKMIIFVCHICPIVH